MPDFVALAARLNQACNRHLANVTGTLDFEPVSGTFLRAYVEPMSGMASTSPMLLLPTADMPAHTGVGATLVLDEAAACALGINTHWRVRAVEPDGTGYTRLALELLA